MNNFDKEEFLRVVDDEDEGTYEFLMEGCRFLAQRYIEIIENDHIKGEAIASTVLVKLMTDVIEYYLKRGDIEYALEIKRITDERFNTVATKTIGNILGVD